LRYKSSLIKYALFMLICLCAVGGLSISGAAAETEQVKVPIVIDISKPIAGAEFEFEYTDGLEFVGFEKSEEVKSASTTPVVKKGEKTYFGFYAAENNYAPQNGKLNVGYLIFNYNGNGEQSVVITEAKFVEVIDKDNTKNELITIAEELKVPLASGATLHVRSQSSALWLYILIAAVIVVSVVCLILLKKRAARLNG